MLLLLMNCKTLEIEHTSKMKERHIEVLERIITEKQTSRLKIKMIPGINKFIDLMFVLLKKFYLH